MHHSTFNMIESLAVIQRLLLTAFWNHIMALILHITSYFKSAHMYKVHTHIITLKIYTLLFYLRSMERIKVRP